MQVSWSCTSRSILRSTFKVSASLIDILGNLKEMSQDKEKNLIHRCLQAEEHQP